MPIPSSETMLVKAEIEAAVFKQAFMELAVEFCRRDRNGFELAGTRVSEVLRNFPVSNFLPPAHVRETAAERELLQESGLRDAIASFDRARRQILNRTR